MPLLKRAQGVGGGTGPGSFQFGARRPELIAAGLCLLALLFGAIAAGPYHGAPGIASGSESRPRSRHAGALAPDSYPPDERGRPLRAGQQTPIPEPTDVPPTPELPTPGPTPTQGTCAAGLPVPRLFWTVHVSPPRDRMWVPFGRNGGPFLGAWVKAKYDQVWYTAYIDHKGRLHPRGNPTWPRPDMIQMAASGVLASRAGNPMCSGTNTLPLPPPPCYTQVVYPIVFLNKLDTDGPYLRRTYFWLSGRQVHADEDGFPARVSSANFCNPDQILSSPFNFAPAYLAFDGCDLVARRVDSCYPRELVR